jgi:hypothetical protein
MAKQTETQRRRKKKPAVQPQSAIVGYRLAPNVAQALLEYLYTRPHGEVRQLVAALEQSPAVTEEPAS